MSTESFIQNIIQSSPQSPNISSEEEMKLMSKLIQAEEKADKNYRKMKSKYKARIAKLEQQISEYKKLLKANNLPENDNKPAEVEEEDIEEDPIPQQPSNRFVRKSPKDGLSKTQYITYLENFAEVKCDEVECLLSRLLKMSQQRKVRINHNQSVKQLQKKCDRLTSENEQLKDNLSRVKLLVQQFVISHRETKAERRTRELEELARIREETESKNLELYSFISTQFQQFVDSDQQALNEDSVKAIIKKAADILKSQSS